MSMLSSFTKYNIPANIVVTTDGTTVTAIQTSNGKIISSSSTAATVIQAAVNALNTGERLVILGNYNIATAITLGKKINYEHYGTATLTGSAEYLILDMDSASYRAKIYIGKINGQDKSRDGVTIKGGCSGSTLEIGDVIQCNHGLYMSSANGSGAGYGDMQIYAYIEQSNYAIYYDTPGGGGEPAREGMALHGAIFSCTHGVYIDTGNTLSGAFCVAPETVIDNSSVGGSFDFEDYSTNGSGHTILAKFIRGNKIISKTMFYYRSGIIPSRFSENNIIPLMLNTGLWSNVTNGTGGTEGYNVLRGLLTTNTTSNDGYQIYSTNSFIANLALKFKANISLANTANCTARFGLLATVSSYVNSDTIQGVQLKWDGTSWKVEVSDGATSQEINTGLAAGAYPFIIHYIPNTSVTVLRGDTYKAVAHTTSTPLPNTTLLPFFQVQTTTTAARTFSITQRPEIEYLQ